MTPSRPPRRSPSTDSSASPPQRRQRRQRRASRRSRASVARGGGRCQRGARRARTRVDAAGVELQRDARASDRGGRVVGNDLRDSISFGRRYYYKFRRSFQGPRVRSLGVPRRHPDATPPGRGRGSPHRARQLSLARSPPLGAAAARHDPRRHPFPPRRWRRRRRRPPSPKTSPHLGPPVPAEPAAMGSPGPRMMRRRQTCGRPAGSVPGALAIPTTASPPDHLLYAFCVDVFEAQASMARTLCSGLQLRATRRTGRCRAARPSRRHPCPHGRLTTPQRVRLCRASSHPRARGRAGQSASARVRTRAAAEEADVYTHTRSGADKAGRSTSEERLAGPGGDAR